MDFVAFYSWRKNFAIGEMVAAPIRPKTCERVFQELAAEGLAKIDKDGFYTLTDKVTEADIAKARRLARQGMNALVADNQRLIRKLVAQLSKRSTARLEEEDLFQSGLMAFMRTLEKFDPDKFSEKKQGASFATYLRHWVRHFIQISRADQQTIKKPRGSGMPASVYKRMVDIQDQTGNRATPEQLGTWKDGKKERVVTQDLLDKWMGERNVIVSIDAMQNASRGHSGHGEGEEQRPFSIAAVLAQSAGDLPDSSKSPEQLLERAQLAQKAVQVVESLCESDRLLVEEIREGVPNKQIAKRLRVTEEYARQIRWALIEKLQRMVGRST